MPQGRTRNGIASVVLLLASALAACGGTDGTGVPDPDDSPSPPPAGNSPPTVGSVEDQTVVRNTLTPRSVDVDLEVEDPDGDPLTVTVESDDQSVIPDQTLTCTASPCPLTLTPAPDDTEHVPLSLTVADGEGGRAETTFTVHVVPLLVTNAEEDGAGSLSATVSAAEPGDVVGFDTGGAFGSARTIGLLGQIVIDETLTVEGTGADDLAVSGNSAVRVFKVEGGASVTIRDLTVQDGSAPLETFETPGGPVERPLGGGVVVGPGSSLELREVIVTGNEADESGGGGGGVANVGGTLILGDSEISANSASSAGGVFTLAADGSDVATTIEGSTIEGNAAEFSGGGVGIGQGTVLVRESTIANNQAQYGAGISNSGTVVLRSNTRVAGNEATRSGGGISSFGTATVVASTLEENSAARGGGIFNDGALDLEGGAVVRRNTAVGPVPDSGEPENGGGGIFNNSDGVASVVEATLGENRSRVGGGGILNLGELTVQASVLDENVADSDEDGSGRGGGIDNRSDRRVTVSGSTIRGNSAAGGGGVSNTGSLVLEDSEIVANTATEEGGGMRSVFGDVLTVTASTVAENSAARGGGIRLGGSGEITVQESVIEDNEATEAGGGLYYEGSNSSSSEIDVAVVDATTVRNNAADQGGGVFYNFSSGVSSGRSRLVLQNGSTVASNDATEGGGIYQTQEFGSGSNAETVIDDSSVEINSAAGAGGGVLIEGGLLTARATSNVDGNTSGADGGGIHIRENVESFREIEVTIDESGVTSNEADRNGGGLYVGSGDEITVSVDGTSCLIVGNTADADDDGVGNGGGLYDAGGDTSAVPSGRVCFNSPDDFGP